MRILVVGAGKVGFAVAEQLSKEDHDIVLIDTDEEVLRRCEDMLDVLCIRGNGANAETLLNAGADRADIVIAATEGDEVNMLTCLFAKRLGAKFAIARIRDPEYNESVSVLRSELGIDLAVNPERATALEISRLLRYPFAANIETFARGRVELVEFRAAENDPVVGIPLRELNSRVKDLPRVLYAAVERAGDVVIPDGDFVIRQDDRVFVTADMITVTNYFRRLGRNTVKVKKVMLLGGGRISYYLARMIQPMGIDVSLLEINEEKARELSEALPDATIICGDGTDQDVLDQEGLRNMDAFVALTDRDEENLMTAMYAAHQGVPKVVAKNYRNAYLNLLGDMGLDSIVSPKSITCALLLRYVRGRANSAGTKVERLYRIMDGKAEALEFLAREGDSYIGIPLKDVQRKQGVLVAVIVRKNRVIVPFGNDTIEAGDTVVVLSTQSGIDDLNDVIFR